jgi:hypothetical protein
MMDSAAPRLLAVRGGEFPRSAPIALFLDS